MPIEFKSSKTLAKIKKKKQRTNLIVQYMVIYQDLTTTKWR